MSRKSGKLSSSKEGLVFALQTIMWCCGLEVIYLITSDCCQGCHAACSDKILEPEIPHALRLQGILIGGIVRIYNKQQNYLLGNC